MLHGPLAGYYRALLPFVTTSCLVAAAFFIEAILTREQLAAILGEAYLADVAFLGLTLVWLGTAQHVFSTVNSMTDTYFAAGDSSGS